MKCGINGSVHDFSDMRVGINGAVRQASELWIGVNGATKKVWPTFPVGGVVVIDVVGSSEWVCPVSGQWEIEMHGGGGGGGQASMRDYGGAGGGSGAKFTLSLTSGQSYSYTVGFAGLGGYTGDSGGKSTFYTVSVDGGSGGSSLNGGPVGAILSGQGTNIATSGGRGFNIGLGNQDNTAQKYGNGGPGGNPPFLRGADGSAGAIILTYLG